MLVWVQQVQELSAELELVQVLFAELELVQELFAEPELVQVHVPKLMVVVG